MFTTITSMVNPVLEERLSLIIIARRLYLMVLSSIFRKFVSDKMKSRAGTRRWSGYAPHNCLKAYAGGEVKSGEAVHLDS